MNALDVLKRILGKAEQRIAAVVDPVPAGPERYSRFNRHPANAHRPLAPGDRVLPNGQVVARDSARPPGEVFVFDEDGLQ